MYESFECHRECRNFSNWVSCRFVYILWLLFLVVLMLFLLCGGFLFSPFAFWFWAISLSVYPSCIVLLNFWLMQVTIKKGTKKKKKKKNFELCNLVINSTLLYWKLNWLLLLHFLQVILHAKLLPKFLQYLGWLELLDYLQVNF